MRYLLIIIFLSVCSAVVGRTVHIEDRGLKKPQKVRTSISPDGIDVSKHQGDINWAVLAKDKNVKFAYIKATEGATYVDPKYRSNVDEARKHKVMVGFYHFFQTKSTIADQFQNIINTVPREDIDLLPMIDVERAGKWTNKQIVDSVLILAQMLEEHYKCVPIIYTYQKFYNDRMAGHFDRYPLFIARYLKPEVLAGDSIVGPTLSDGKDYVLWQYSERGRVKGIDGNVDLDCFMEGYSIDNIRIANHKPIKGEGLEFDHKNLAIDHSEVELDNKSMLATSVANENTPKKTNTNPADAKPVRSRKAKAEKKASETAKKASDAAKKTDIEEKRRIAEANAEAAKKAEKERKALEKAKKAEEKRLAQAKKKAAKAEAEERELTAKEIAEAQAKARQLAAEGGDNGVYSNTIAEQEVEEQKAEENKTGFFKKIVTKIAGAFGAGDDK